MNGKGKFFAGLLERKSLIIMLVVMVFAAVYFHIYRCLSKSFLR